ncbi:MAG: type II secretion system F family protein [Candidatus Brennerbacteria bacterium]
MNKTPRKSADIGSLFSTVSLQEKVNFARHLSVTIRSGIPLIEGLKLIQGQAKSKKFGAIIGGIVDDISGGTTLAEGLERRRGVFGDFFISLVKVGETSGNLADTLLYISQELKKQRDVNNRVRGALIYPLVILVVTVAITIFLTVFIFPKILPIFVSLKVQLPVTTRFIIQLLTFFSEYGLYALIGLAAFVVGVKLILMVKKVHFWFDALLLQLPFISRILIAVTMTNFMRSLSVLLKSSMALVDALEVAKGTFHNLYYRALVDDMVARVRRGEEMGRALVGHPKLFPSMVVGMIQVGERTGTLEENLLYLSDYYEGEVDDIVKNLTTTLEPFLLLLMGFIVGFVALSIITPIYKITQEVRIR